MKQITKYCLFECVIVRDIGYISEKHAFTEIYRNKFFKFKI